MNELYADLNQARIFSTYDIFLGRKKQKSTRPDIVMRLAQCMYIPTCILHQYLDIVNGSIKDSNEGTMHVL